MAAPLAEILRPKTLDDVVGQAPLLGPQWSAPPDACAWVTWLDHLLGPPGTGKTTIARLLADAADMAFEPISAVFDGVGELRKVFDRAAQRRHRRDGAHFYLLTKSTGLTRRSRMACCRVSKTVQ